MLLHLALYSLFDRDSYANLRRRFSTLLHLGPFITFRPSTPFWLFASSVNCDLGGQWAMDRFEE